MKDYYILVFESRNHILYLQSSLEAKGKNYFQLISAPCSLKSGYGCNYALKISSKDYFPLLRSEIDKLNLGNYKIFLVKKGMENKPKYKEIEL